MKPERSCCARSNVGLERHALPLLDCRGVAGAGNGRIARTLQTLGDRIIEYPRRSGVGLLDQVSADLVAADVHCRTHALDRQATFNCRRSCTTCATDQNGGCTRLQGQIPLDVRRANHALSRRRPEALDGQVSLDDC